MALNDEQIQKVRLTLASSGWTEVMYPALVNRGQQAVKALILSRSERTSQYKGTDFDTDDEVLRAMIRDTNWMVVCWANEINVAEYNRQRDELDAGTRTQEAASPNG